MIGDTILAGLFGFVLALALIVAWRLMLARQDPSHVPTIVSGLIGLALGIVLWQFAQELTTTSVPVNDNPARLVETERHAREQDTIKLTAHLDNLEKSMSSIERDIRQLKSDTGKLSQTGETLKSIRDTLSRHEGRIKALENPPPPDRPPPVTVNAVQVRAYHVPGGLATLRLYPQIVTSPGSTVQSADISMCPLPVGGTGCTKADITKGCKHSFICDGHGTFVTIPPAVAANGGQFCVQLIFTLQDQMQGVAPGGPLQARAGANWQRDLRATTPCDQVSSKQETTPQ
jgi:hypothetical protein